MKFKYTICHPDRKEIEFPSEILDSNEVLKFAKNYPWEEQMTLSIELPEKQVYFSPSVEFTNIETSHGFTLTAEIDNGQVKFALWYNRPKKVNILFGLLGNRERMEVDDVWPYNLDDAIHYLEHFVNGNYQIIEELYQ